MVYLDISNRRSECHLGLVSLMDSYIFSLETIVRYALAATVDVVIFEQVAHLTNRAYLLCSCR